MKSIHLFPRISACILPILFTMTAFAEESTFAPGRYSGDEATRIGREVLEKVETVNRHWLFTSKPEVETWSYTFKARNADGKTMEKRIDVDRSVGVWERMRGITYSGVPQSLCSGSPTFKSVEIDRKQIKLHFLCRDDEIPGQRIGLGLDGSWFGFFQTRMPEGMLYVNAADFTLVGVKTPSGSYEKYTEYVPLDETGRVPCRVQIENVSRGGNMTFDFRFNAFEPGLWLLNRAEYRIGGRKFSEAVLDDVEVNGTPPVVIDKNGTPSRNKK